MKSRWKRNAVVGTMVVLVCAAVGLNWRFAGQQAREAEEAGARLLGEATLVSGQESGALGQESGQDATGGVQDWEAAGTDGESGLLVDETAAYAGADYFASARLTRQQARDNAISLLQEAAAQESADEDVLNEASEGIQVLATYTLKEAQIENLVTAKGYQDCVAFMGDGSVSVVVSNGQEELSAEDVARIKDIAMSETGFPASGVKIMTAN